LGSQTVRGLLEVDLMFLANQMVACYSNLAGQSL
jgi:hypothetical protein